MRKKTAAGAPIPPTFNVQLLHNDMAEEGWLVSDLARQAGLANMTVHRFFDGRHRTVRTAKKLADALKQPLRRYMTTANPRESSREAVAR